MSRQEHLKAEFKDCTGPFEYSKLTRLLGYAGYELKRSNSGSSRAFANSKGQIIMLHEPHPGTEVKYYKVKEIKALMIERGEL